MNKKRSVSRPEITNTEKNFGSEFFKNKVSKFYADRLWGIMQKQRKKNTNNYTSGMSKRKIKRKVKGDDIDWVSNFILDFKSLSDSLVVDLKSFTLLEFYNLERKLGGDRMCQDSIKKIIEADSIFEDDYHKVVLFLLNRSKENTYDVVHDNLSFYVKKEILSLEKRIIKKLFGLSTFYLYFLKDIEKMIQEKYDNYFYNKMTRNDLDFNLRYKRVERGKIADLSFTVAQSYDIDSPETYI